MLAISQVEALRSQISLWRAQGQQIVLVPTMGNLHAGHCALISHACRPDAKVVASIFVNPAQFGPGEDYAAYPRTPETDADSLREHGCDLLFLPEVETMYPAGVGNGVRLLVGDLGSSLCGAVRPGHFDGVARVVAKLFNLVQPDVAVFGQKDYQQLLVIRHLVDTLNFPIVVESLDTVREPDGLAMSSRNRYLLPEERSRAAVIYQSLCQMRDQFRTGAMSLSDIEDEALLHLRNNCVEPDYAVLRRASDLGLPQEAHEAGIALIAGRLGRARLIDNLLL